jgi:hypothetical protein
VSLVHDDLVGVCEQGDFPLVEGEESLVWGEGDPGVDLSGLEFEVAENIFLGQIKEFVLDELKV